MGFGYDNEPRIFNLNDTSSLVAVLYDDEDRPYSYADLISVSFEIQKPDNNRVTVAGDLDEEGKGIALFDDTALAGQYMAVATFVTVDEGNKSTRLDFQVIDPFNPPTPSNIEILGEKVWERFEDLFDASDEGPWLRDMTKNTFTKKKMPRFVDEALFKINQQNPPTDLTLDMFYANGQPTADLPLVTEGAYLAVVRHLIRSYVEQPTPTGINAGWMDRRDYMARWMQVYQMEYEMWQGWLALYKRQFLGLGHSKVLVSSKAGRLMPGPLRTRNIGRGFY